MVDEDCETFVPLKVNQSRLDSSISTSGGKPRGTKSNNGGHLQSFRDAGT